jgi:Flp pilus assembly protein TadD
LSQDPIFGIGPNRFSEAWNLYKSSSINDTQFWNVDFGSGFGFLPTHLSTNGILSLVAWLVFILLFIFVGIKNTLSGVKNNFTWELFAFFLLAVYLLTFIIFYSVSSTIFFLFLVFVGVFVGLLSSVSENKIQISFLGSQKKSFVSVLLLIVLIVSSSALAFKYTEKFVSVYYFRKSLQVTDIGEAEKYLRKAISLNPNDLYLRTFTQVTILKLNAFLEKKGTPTEEEKAEVQTNLNQAINAAELAVSYNKENYLNYQMLGHVYRNAVVLGAKDAYTEAVLAYEEATKTNPFNPGLKLAIADSYFSGGKIAEAKEYANKALSLKQDYVEALIFMSQVYKQEGNNKEALKYAEKVRVLLPGDQGILDYIKSLNSSAPVPSATETPKQ